MQTFCAGSSGPPVQCLSCSFSCGVNLDPPAGKPHVRAIQEGSEQHIGMTTL